MPGILAVAEHGLQDAFCVGVHLLRGCDWSCERERGWSCCSALVSVRRCSEKIPHTASLLSERKRECVLCVPLINTMKVVTKWQAGQLIVSASYEG